ncbi:MAG: hypothetical protein NC191_04930 [Muribaculaceae bacterium]|nr:hypothetical protein [Muribaculaceae bacterium]
MAASQARWISLAARKTNVEYEGQQINQARTALANQSSELWNSLYKMDVPTPPSTNEFSTTQYTFKSGDATETITSIQDADYVDTDGIRYNSYISYSSKISEYSGIRNTKTNPQVQRVANPETGDEYYMVGTKKLTALSSVPGDEDKQKMWDTYAAALDQIAEDWQDSQLAKDWLSYKGGDTTAVNNIYLWADAENKINFTSATSLGNDGLEACIQDTTLALHSYYADYQYSNKELSKFAIIDYDASGRATTLQLEGSSATYPLTATSVTDNAAYEDAMNQYNYEQQVYEKKVQDINAKTEQIQTEDRTLELRLKALDTEQNALQQEMEAVHKIISKNIESTFKTFEG